MLSTDHRTLYSDALRPPSGYRFDCAVGATYSLDLEALLLVPLQAMTLDSGDPDGLLDDPIALVRGLQTAADRITVFCQADRIHVPAAARPVYAWLEDSVVPVSIGRRKGRRGNFHPKVWVLRFLREDEVAHRVVVLSRNLTFDRSWDVVLAADGVPDRRIQHQNTDLVRFLRALPDIAIAPLSSAQRERVELLATELRRVRFPAPEHFEGPITFHAPGLTGRSWKGGPRGNRLLVVSPFLSASTLTGLKERFSNPRLISRPESLDALPAETLTGWDVRTLRDEVAIDDDEDRPRLCGLHAKLYITEVGSRFRWLLGSANCSANAFDGVNVEFVAELNSRR